MEISKSAAQIIKRLESAGFQAFLVGGCVRDYIMGKQPHDFDIAASALPEQTKSVFSDLRIIETGIKHGTVTIIYDNEPFEITTFRIDEGYSDGRHPDKVKFAAGIEDDLSRRDFTINGMAYNPDTGLIDPFGGAGDIRRGVIRCIGNPQKRFKEDALRILRALRFSSVLNFTINMETAVDIHLNKKLLNNLSAERIFSELLKLLEGDNLKVLLDYPDVFSVIIPELAPCVGYNQRSMWHNLTLYEHMAVAAANAPKEKGIRLAMFLHDIGKPISRTFGEDGQAHYYNHASKGAVMAQTALKRLKCPNALRERVCMVIKRHDLPLQNNKKIIKRRLSQYGMDGFKDIINAHIADDSAKVPNAKSRIPLWKKVLETAEIINSSKPCLTLKDLAVNGNDLTKFAPPSPVIGKALNYLLLNVINEKFPNDREFLLKESAKYIAKQGKK